jgi:hypothetical protein
MLSLAGSSNFIAFVLTSYMEELVNPKSIAINQSLAVN